MSRQSALSTSAAGQPQPARASRPGLTALAPPPPGPPRGPGRRTLPPRVAYALAAFVIGLSLFGSTTPSPLYRTYSALWHFSPLTLTLIYASYAFGIQAALLLAGRVSDQVGRRPVLLAALGALIGSLVLFMAASATAWLFAARAVQGLATGAALSTASAALLDLHPRRDVRPARLPGPAPARLRYRPSRARSRPRTRRGARHRRPAD